MRLTTSDLVALSVLLNGKPMHGYELVKKLEEADFEDWAPISRPQVYYSLRKLAKNGYIKPAKDQENSGGPERTIYKPTSKAKRAMQAALADEKWMEQQPVSPFFTWSALAIHADAETIEAQLEKRAAFLKARIAREEKTLQDFGSAHTKDIVIAKAMITAAIKQFQAELDALPEFRRALLLSAPKP